MLLDDFRIVSVVHCFSALSRCLDRESASSTFCVYFRLLRTRREMLSCRDRKESTRYRKGICSEYQIPCCCCCRCLAQGAASVECANPKCPNFASLREQNPNQSQVFATNEHVCRVCNRRYRRVRVLGPQEPLSRREMFVTDSRKCAALPALELLKQPRLFHIKSWIKRILIKHRNAMTTLDSVWIVRRSQQTDVSGEFK